MTPRGGPRPGAGSEPRLLDGQTISAYLDAPTIDKIDRICKEYNLNRSEAIRACVRLARIERANDDNENKAGVDSGIGG